MPSRVFVGNLPYEATEDEIREHFSGVAPVSRVFMPLDRDTGRPRGFAFVEYAEAEQATAAIEQLHQQPFKDRPLIVNEARPSEGRPSGGARPVRPGGGGSVPFRPQTRERTTLGGSPEGAPPRSPSPSRSRRRGKRPFWEEGPKKEPIPEKRRGQILSGYDDVDEDEEEIDFENFATGLPDIDDEE